MLVASEPGRVQLLPALPSAWPHGTIEGPLCRGGIEINRLSWNDTKLAVTLTSKSRQDVILELPADIRQFKVTEGDAEATNADGAHQRKLTLPAGQAVVLEITLVRSPAVPSSR
jgi:hypothetical protein